MNLDTITPKSQRIMNLESLLDRCLPLIESNERDFAQRLVDDIRLALGMPKRCPTCGADLE